MDSQKKVTVKDIASMAGVSIGTVDRVLHNRGRVAQTTQKCIMEIVRRTGFRPNPHASNLAQSKSYKISVITPLPEQDSGYWKLPHSGMYEAVEELRPYSILLEFHCFDRFDPESFLAATRKVTESAPDGILLAPVLPREAEGFISSLAGDPPVCLFDTDLPDTPTLAYIGQDSFSSGKLAGKLMRILVPEDRKTVIIQAVTRDYHIHDRISGFLSMYTSGHQPVTFAEEHLDRKKTRDTFMKKMLSEIPDTAGIFVTNDSAHLIAEYLFSHNMSRISLIGYDLIPENHIFLENGTIDFIIHQRPVTQGNLGVKVLIRAIQGQEISKSRIIMPIDILAAENARYYTPREPAMYG